MTTRIGNVIVLHPEKPQQCDACGKVAELRPYGPGGTCVCFECAMKDKPGTEARMAHKLFGDPIPKDATQ